MTVTATDIAMVAVAEITVLNPRARNKGSPQGLCAKARLEAQSMNIDYAAR